VTCGSGMTELTRTCPDNSHCVTAMMAVCRVEPVSAIRTGLMDRDLGLENHSNQGL